MGTITVRFYGIEQKMSQEQIDALPPDDLENLELRADTGDGWIRPARFLGGDDDIEVIL